MGYFILQRTDRGQLFFKFLLPLSVVRVSGLPKRDKGLSLNDAVMTSERKQISVIYS